MPTNNIFRKVLQKTGLDIHRYRHTPKKTDWLTGMNIQTVIDVGANTGQFAEEIRSVLPDAHIHSFEPLKECFEVLQKKKHTDSQFTAYHCALGTDARQDTIHKSSYTLSSSILPMSQLHKTAFPHTKDSEPEEIEIKRMDDVLENIDLPQNILVKIDTQGFEDRVIAGGPKTLAQAKILIVENSFVPLYKGQKLFKDIYRILETQGFTYRGALHQKVAKNGEILFEDSWFIRE